MASTIYWIESAGVARLAIMARPRAGDWLEDEIDNWRTEDVQLVVSLLEPSEVMELGLETEADLCKARGIEFLAFPIPDRGVPNFAAASRLVRVIKEMGKDVAIHCRAGIGRSSLIAAAILTTEGLSPGEAFDRIKAARGVLVPDTDEQRAWVEALHQQSLGT